MHTFKIVLFALFLPLSLLAMDEVEMDEGEDEITSAQDPFLMARQKQKAYSQWRQEYQRFVAENRSCFIREKMHDFLYPFIESLYSDNIKDNKQTKNLSYKLNFYLINPESRKQEWLKYHDMHIKFEKPEDSNDIPYKSLGRYKVNHIFSEKFPLNFSGLHLVFIPIGDELLIFDPFSLCGTDVLDPTLSTAKIVKAQMNRTNFDPIIISDAPVALLVATTKLEIIPLIDEIATLEAL